MSIRRIIIAALVIPLALVSNAPAERAPEERSDATHVVIGTVEGVYARKADGTIHYIVEIAVEKVEKGDGLKPGAKVYAACYRHDHDRLKGKNLSEAELKQELFRGSSYDKVPKEGERIRAFVKLFGGKYYGIFPSWYDTVK